jgi:hypothetical protein
LPLVVDLAEDQLDELAKRAGRVHRLVAVEVVVAPQYGVAQVLGHRDPCDAAVGPIEIVK